MKNLTIIQQRIIFISFITLLFSFCIAGFMSGISTTNTEFETLIHSKEYIESNYQVCMYGDEYCLKVKTNSEYVDLRHNYFTWTSDNYDFCNCLGNKATIIKVFKELNIPKLQIVEIK